MAGRSRTSQTRSAKRSWTVPGTILAAAVLVSACASESGHLQDTTFGPADDPDSSTTTLAPTPEDEELAFTGVEVTLRDVLDIEDMLRQEPEELGDVTEGGSSGQDGLGEDLANLHTPDSPHLASFLDEINQLADDGEHYEPASAAGNNTQLAFGTMELTDANTVEFRYCIAVDAEIVDRDGNNVEDVAFVEFGDGEAHLAEDTWLIHDLVEVHQVDLTPGLVTEDECSRYDVDAPELR